MSLQSFSQKGDSLLKLSVEKVTLKASAFSKTQIMKGLSSQTVDDPLQLVLVILDELCFNYSNTKPYFGTKYCL